MSASETCTSGSAAMSQAITPPTIPAPRTIAFGTRSLLFGTRPEGSTRGR
jgi:hypothetical protein